MRVYMVSTPYFEVLKAPRHINGTPKGEYHVLPAPRYQALAAGPMLMHNLWNSRLKTLHTRKTALSSHLQHTS